MTAKLPHSANLQQSVRDCSGGPSSLKGASISSLSFKGMECWACMSNVRVNLSPAPTSSIDHLSEVAPSFQRGAWEGRQNGGEIPPAGPQHRTLHNF